MVLSTTPTNDIVARIIGNLGPGEGMVGAEISAFDSGSDRLFVTSSTGLQIVSLADPANPAFISQIDFAAAPISAISSDVSSVAAKNGIIAVTLLNADKTLPGEVVLLDAATGNFLSKVTAGNHPDMLTFTPDGSKILVANEGELDGLGGDGAGSVSIIDISAGAGAPMVQHVLFDAFNGQEAALRAAGVRIFDGKSVSQDVEPEYIAISPDGTKAMITLQENNAVAILDIATASITSIVPLGTKDFSTLLADFSDRDGAGGTALVNLTTGNPVKGLYMPDAIASFAAGGATFYVIANEGDDRDDFLTPDETIRAGAAGYDLDNTVFPNEATLKGNGVLGRLTVSNAPGLRGDTDNDGDIDEILSYGARSFSILDANGAVVFDSADIMERVIAAMPSTVAPFDDTRSDNKGPEPEGVTITQISGRTYAFVGIERSAGGVMIFDISSPADVTFTGYVSNAPTDISPEGLTLIPAANSPNGKALLVITNEVSNTVSVLEIVNLQGTTGNDTLTGTSNGETIEGDAGNDILNGGGGNDTLNGGTGTDTADYSDAAGGVLIDLNSGKAESKAQITTEKSMLAGENGFSVIPLLTIGETLRDTTGALNAKSAGDYAPVGVLDGIGAFELNANTVRVFVNHELANTAGTAYETENGVSLKGARISYFDIDKTTKEIKDGGLAIKNVYDASGNLATDASFTFNNNLGFERFCSGSLYEANTFGAGKGLTDRIYFANEETGGTFSAVAGNAWALDVATGNLWDVPAFGRGGWENVTEVDTGNTTHVAFILADDTSPFNADGDPANEAAPLYLYVGAKSTAADANFLEKNGLSGGKLYVWVPGNPALNSPITFNGNGTTQPGSWVEIENLPNGTPSEDGSTGFDESGYPTQRTLWQRAEAVGSFQFSRPEDVATNPANGKEFVLASTGSSALSDANGTVYTMTLDVADINAPAGTLKVLYDGNDDAAVRLRNPDNLDWADDGSIYIQEDRSTSSLFGTAAVNKNEASIVKIDPVTGALKRVAEIDRTGVPAGQTDTSPTDIGNWESSGILDVSALFGLAGGSLFIADVQAHSVRDGSIGGSTSLVEGGQLSLIAAPGVDISRASGKDTLVSIENANGSANADTIIGSNSANRLDGKGGDDALIGLKGNDTYVVDRSGDMIVEIAGEGTDTVVSTVNFTLAANLERVELVGLAALSATGNDANNTLIGNGGANTLNGGGGNDYLLGAGGTDIFIGGAGNDMFVVDSASETIVELAGGGSDAVISSVTFDLGSAANVERLSLRGNGAINGTGNALHNGLNGAEGANTLSGLDGNDIINGGLGTDTLTGGAGLDIFVFNTALGAGNIDTVTDFNAALDTFRIDNAVFTVLASTGALAAGFFRAGAAARDADDFIIYNQTTGALFYDSNANGAGGAVQFAQLTAGTLVTAADFTVI